MSWKIEFSEQAESDIGHLFQHLTDSYLEFGETRIEAAQRAADRVGQILDRVDRIAAAPHRGEAHDDLMPGLRHLTLERAIYWYRTNEARRVVLILAIFYGGQNHQRRMLLRQLGDLPQG